MLQIIHRTREVKLYLNKAQVASLTSWLGSCCFWFNQCLQKKKEVYAKEKKGISLFDHNNLLAAARKTDERLRGCPVVFSRDAARRVDRGMQAFFRRVKAGLKPGFPRFKPATRYNSMEALAESLYVRGDKIYIPNLGEISCRGTYQDFSGKQKALRVIRRASGWYAQVVLEQETEVKEKQGKAVGIDLGLESFATLSTGEKIENPRFFRKGQRKLKRLQRRLSRKTKGSANRRKAIKKVARQHERIKAQRKDFAHQEARKLVKKFSTIVYEDLNIKGLARGRLAKSVHDAGWGQFIRYLVYKAAEAGKRTVAVDPRGTSQTCPSCGEVRKKELSERVHHCDGCDLILDRDHAAALVIKERAQGIARALKPAESVASAQSRLRKRAR